VGSTAGSLAHFLNGVHAAPPEPGYSYEAHPHLSKASAKIDGVFDTASVQRISILNGNHKTVSDDHDCETVLVMPDFIAITEIPTSPEGAEKLWRHALDPSVARGAAASSQDGLKAWMLEYSCVIMLCELAHVLSACVC
jgi:hypothetical protein